MMSGKIVYIDELFTLVINASLEESRQVMMVEMPNKHTLAVVSSKVAGKLDLVNVNEFSQGIFRQLLAVNGVLLETPVEVFYFSENEKARMLTQAISGDIRPLSAADSDCVNGFLKQVSEEAKLVSEIDVTNDFLYGCFEKGELMCLASGSVWNDSPFTDVRVVTKETNQEFGIATNVVKALCAAVIANGGEPQLRCLVDSDAALGVADAVESTPFGKLEIATL